MVALRRPSLGVITSGFGARTGGFHEGIDFGWGNGWNIYAAASGTVRHAGPGAGYGARYGNLTILDHPGFQTRYAHQSRMYVRVGQKVSAGQLIGVIGGSGARGANTYDPHLHFELLINGRKVNPISHFTAPAGTTTGVDMPLTAADLNAIWSVKVKRSTGPVTALQELADAKTIGMRNEAKLAALESAVKALAAKQGIDPIKLKADIDAAVEGAMANVTVDASIDPEDLAAIADAVNDDAAARLKS